MNKIKSSRHRKTGADETFPSWVKIELKAHSSLHTSRLLFLKKQVWTTAFVELIFSSLTQLLNTSSPLSLKSYAFRRFPLFSLPALVALLMAVMGGVEAGFPSVTPTVGSVWPRPLAWETRDTYYVIRPDAFKYLALAFLNICSCISIRHLSILLIYIIVMYILLIVFVLFYIAFKTILLLRILLFLYLNKKCIA